MTALRCPSDFLQLHLRAKSQDRGDEPWSEVSVAPRFVPAVIRGVQVRIAEGLSKAAEGFSYTCGEEPCLKGAHSGSTPVSLRSHSSRVPSRCESHHEDCTRRPKACVQGSLGNGTILL
jgi:hypothetical protein